MKKLLLLAAMIATAAVISGFAVSGATAGSTSYSVSCTVLDAFQNGVSTTGIVTVYSGGKVTLHCIGQGAGNGTVVTWNFANTGFSCNVDVYGSTTNWTDRVSKSGESQLWCYTTTDAVRAPAGGSSGVG